MPVHRSQVAHIGLTERDARQSGVAVRMAKLPMAGVLRTRTIDEMGGFMKALIGGDDRVLGFTMIGPEAGEVLARRADGDARRVSLHGFARRCPHASDDGGRAQRAVSAVPAAGICRPAALDAIRRPIMDPQEKYGIVNVARGD